MIKKVLICCLMMVCCFAGSAWAGEIDKSEKRYEEIVVFISEGQMENIFPFEHLLTNKKISKQEVCWLINHFIEKARKKFNYDRVHISKLNDFSYSDMGYVNDFLVKISSFESNEEYGKDDFAEDFFSILFFI